LTSFDTHVLDYYFAPTPSIDFHHHQSPDHIRFIVIVGKIRNQPSSYGIFIHRRIAAIILFFCGCEHRIGKRTSIEHQFCNHGSLLLETSGCIRSILCDVVLVGGGWIRYTLLLLFGGATSTASYGRCGRR
jgi:hypothetical protein